MSITPTRASTRRAALAAHFLHSPYSLPMRAPSAAAPLPDWFETALAAVRLDTPEIEAVVTEEGFVTMALDLARAEMVAGAVVLPGYDSAGEFGHMVFRPGARPFHAREITPTSAAKAASLAHSRARRLEVHFGSRDAVRRVALRASPLLWCTLEDAQRAGLCAWGIESFLKRYHLFALTKRLGGLPKGVIAFGGSYVRRTVASAVMRGELRTTAPVSVTQILLDERTIRIQ
jgi:hypothetical protein